MSRKLFEFSWKNHTQATILPVLVICALLIGGCGSKSKQNVHLQQSGYNSSKDGIALTASQQKIFNLTGELDKKLPKKGLPAVATQYSHFLNKGRGTMTVFSQRSEIYLGHAKEVFRQRGMPEELAYLAIVESGYRPQVKSHAGAAGAWQFMPYTGKRYGLKQDWWIDERLDPYKAVEAAADYLQKLHGYFDNWLLAVAAYNAGEGKISRALKGTGAKDFFTLVERNHRLSQKEQLRKETIEYVPRFLAVSKIMRNLGPLGFKTIDLHKAPIHTRVAVKPGTDLKAMAQAIGSSWEDFRKDNTAHLRYVTHAEYSTYVYVPNSRSKTAKTYASRGKSLYAWNTVTIPSKTSWSTLSKKSGVPVSALKASNRKYSSLRAGAKIRIPSGPGVKKVAFTSVASKKSSSSVKKSTASNNSRKKSATKARTYTVKSGETVLGIAIKHNVTMDALLKANNINNASKIRIGQKLTIPTKSSTQVAQIRTHTVKSGDTFWGIAQKYNLSTSELLKLNKKKKDATLRPGDTLLVSMR